MSVSDHLFHDSNDRTPDLTSKNETPTQNMDVSFKEQHGTEKSAVSVTLSVNLHTCRHVSSNNGTFVSVNECSSSSVL